MTPRLAAAALAALSLLAPSFARGQASVRVERRGPARVQAQAGSQATAVFHVASLAAAPLAADPRVALPAGWRLVMPEAAWTLAPRAGETHLLSIAVPAGAAAGAYVVRYAVRTGGGESADSAVVDVAVRRRVEVQVADAPRFAVSGAGYVAEFTVRNAGNGPERLRLSVRGDRGLSASLDAAEVALGPGESRTVRATVAPDGARTSRYTHVLTLAAAAAGDPAAAASAASRVEIVPAPGRQGARFHTVPAEVRLRANGLQGAASIVPAVTAYGPVAGAGSPRLDVQMQGADARPGVPGENSIYRAELQGDAWGVGLGDQVFSLTPLTEPAVYGFGGRGRVEGRWGSLAAFGARDRRSPVASGEAGGAVGLGPAWARVQAAWLRRTGRDAGTVRSLGATVAPFHGATAQAEAASTAGGGTARMARVDYVAPALSLTARHVDVDGDFASRQRGVREDAAALRLGSAGPRAEARVLRRRDGTEFVAPAAGLRSDRERAELALGWGSLATVRGTAERRRGTLFSGPYDRTARSLSAEATLRSGRVWLRPGGEWGVGTDGISGADEPFRRLWVQAGAATHGGSFVSISVRDQQGRGAQPIAPLQGWSGSFDAGLNVFGATVLRFSAQATRWPSGSTAGVVDVSVQQGLPFGQRVVARTRTGVGTDPLGPARALSSVDYVVPVAVPVSPRRQAGTASGRIYDAETGRGVAGVPVRVGGRVATTDAQGRWQVAGLEDGEHTVEPDRLAVGVGRIPASGVATTVDVRGGRAARLEMPLVRGGSVAGVLRGAPGDSAGALAGAVLVLSSGESALRRAVDRAGRFRFDDLPPGRWVLRADPATLPAFHLLRGDSAVVDVAAGAAHTVQPELMERQRAVQIVAEADVVLSAPRAAAPGRPVPSPAPSPAPSTPAAQPTRVARAPRVRPAPPAAVAVPADEEPVAGAALEYDEIIGTYTVVAGDRDLVAISYLAYATGDLWPRLWLANRDVLPDPGHLTPGVELRIPAPGPLTDAEREALRRWQARPRR